MNSLWKQATAEAKYEKLKKLEGELQWIKEIPTGTLIVCPFCNYLSKSNRGSAKVFQNENSSSFKCFNCGQWRKI